MTPTAAEASRIHTATRKSCPGCEVARESDDRIRHLEQRVANIEGTILTAVQQLGARIDTVLAIATPGRPAAAPESSPPGQVEVSAGKWLKLKGGAIPVVIVAIALGAAGASVAHSWGLPKRVQTVTGH